MREQDFKPLAAGRLSWLTSDEGGRAAPPPGPIFAATARLRPPLEGGDLSVVLRYAADAAVAGRPGRVEVAVEVAFLAPELVRQRLAPGLEFRVMEGSRPVADCTVTEVLNDPAA
jgi:hypothetical protein